MPSLPIATSERLPAARKALLRWYDQNRRDLPWRRTTDPYRIWISEIMLQQTRVSAVLEHYRQFVARFPSVKALARAPLADVLAAWSGLGYYRRARALHQAAQLLVKQYSGKLPSSLEQLRELPGIGRYTSAAIGSIAFGIPSAVVDGNVERVLTRLCGTQLQNAETWQIAQQFLHLSRPGDWNQAMMELGATVCLPVSPKCSECPLKPHCTAPGHETRRSEPTRLKRKRFVGLAARHGSVYLVQRSERESLMAGMWELPDVPPGSAKPLATMKHSITITDFDVAVLPFTPNPPAPGRWFKLSKLSTLPITGLTRKVLRRTNLLSVAPNLTSRGQ